MNGDIPLKLLIVAESPNEAERFVSLLRNAGHAVRDKHVEDDEDFQGALKEDSFDLVLCAEKLEFIDYKKALSLLKEANSATPLIVVAADPDDNLRVAALSGGARDIINVNVADQLPLVVSRELEAVRVRSSLDDFRDRFAELERRNRTLLDSSRDAITYVHDGMHVYANASYLRTFGYTDLEEIESTPIMDMVQADHRKELKELLRSTSKMSGNENRLNVTCQREDGGSFKAIMEFSRASIEGEPCTQIFIRDQSVNKELEKKLKALSNQDLLTGLFNRQYFLEELELATAQADKAKEPKALLYIELDEFRAITEKVGIAAGDLVLVDIANLITIHTNEGDILARFGDHTFAVITAFKKEEYLLEYAEDIRKALESHISEAADKGVTLTCSIGLAMVGEGAKTAQEVLSRSDIACEMAREEGGNKIHRHNPVADSDANVERDQQWVERLKLALKKDQFRLYYQPIVSLMGEAAENYQVLLRMIDDAGKEVLPGEFMPIAAEHKLLPYIDRWVINHLLPVLAEQYRNKKKTGFMIKLAAQSFCDSSLLSWFADQMRNAKLPGERIIFELNEADALAHVKEAKAFINGAKALRCKLALAKFGGSPNPLNSLQHLPVQFVKFDRTLMHQLSSDPNQQKIVRTLNEKVHELGKITIAEFVEDASSLSALFQCGVDYIQGYFLQEPSDDLTFDFSQE